MEYSAPESASDFLRTAIRAAEAAAEISSQFYRENLTVTLKEDRSPVTDADVACETEIRRIIEQDFPEHGFFGEETGRSGNQGEYLWLVDPIDGTKGFIREYPFFSTQIALMHQGEIIVGVSCAAMMNELACAERGGGAWLNGRRINVSTISQLRNAAVSTGNLKSIAAASGWQQLAKLILATDRIRGYGDFYHYHLLAAGKIDVVIESDVNILDIAALSIIVEEAGGVFTDLNGARPSLGTSSVLATNGELHDALRRQFANWDASA